MTRHHYIITLQFETRNGVQSVFYEHGVITPATAETRGDVFRRIFQGAAKQGGGSNPVPLFFSLEPEELPAGVPRGRREGRRATSGEGRES